MTTIDRYIIRRIIVTTALMLLLLIFIFIVIDFSENSDDFTDRGATYEEIWGTYYLNYIPEIIRLVTPVAFFVAVLLVTGQLADRVEIIALKSAGVSLYRLLAPYMVLALFVLIGLSYLDGFIVPQSNAKRIGFERQYINKRSDRIDKSRIYRQESDSTLITISYFDASVNQAYKASIYQFRQDTLFRLIEAKRMMYRDSTKQWVLVDASIKRFVPDGYHEQRLASKDTVFSLLPRDLARTTTDIYQLTYPEIMEYIQSIERSGAGNENLPKVQFYSKAFFPFSLLVVTLLGVSLASVRRKGGKGVYLFIGLVISFGYLVAMKLLEPLGSAGTISPLNAALTPHIVFLILALLILIKTRK